jgi:hypothetical protein
VRAIEKETGPKANFKAVMEHERRISPSLDGRTVFDKGSRTAVCSANQQLDLFHK